MWLRRSFGLLLTFTMAHVAMVGSDLACDRHGPGASPAADMAAMHHGDGASEHAGDNTKKPCDVPASNRCCDAVTSCAVGATLAPAMSLHEMPLVASTFGPSIDEIPLSRVVAPDPPPPKY